MQRYNNRDARPSRMEAMNAPRPRLDDVADATDASTVIDKPDAIH